MTDIALAGHGKARCKEPIVEDGAAGQTGTTHMGTNDALAPTSGEGWEAAGTEATAAQDTLITTADSWGAANSTPAAEGNLIPTGDSWGAAEPSPAANGWSTEVKPSENGW